MGTEYFGEFDVYIGSASPLPLGKQAKSELNTKESRMVDTILERIYAKGRKTANAFAEVFSLYYIISFTSSTLIIPAS